jgi:hypothetical protein
MFSKGRKNVRAMPPAAPAVMSFTALMKGELVCNSVSAMVAVVVNLAALSTRVNRTHATGRQ